MKLKINLIEDYLLLITYENDFGEKIIELDGIIDIENIQILITALTELKNDFGGK